MGAKKLKNFKKLVELASWKIHTLQKKTIYNIN